MNSKRYKILILICFFLGFIYFNYYHEKREYKNYQLILFEKRNIDFYPKLEEVFKIFGNELGLKTNMLIPFKKTIEAKKLVLHKKAVSANTEFDFPDLYIDYYRLESGDVHIQLFTNSEKKLFETINLFNKKFDGYKYKFLKNPQN